METIFDRILRMLDKNQIPYSLTEHEPVRTSEDAAHVRGIAMNFGAKSMIVKADGTFILLVLPADKKIDWKKVKKQLHVKNVRFAGEEEAEDIAHVKMGSVPPFAELLGVAGLYDEKLFELEYIYFNPGSVCHTLQMKSEDLKRIIHVSPVSITEGKD